MKVMVFLTFLIMSFGASGLAFAGDEFTAKDLANYCNHESGPDVLVCVAYTAGFGDGISAGLVSGLDQTRGKVCIPSKINGARARFIARNFLRDHQEVLAESAKDALTLAMWEAYPCK
jgi:Rap1a immunity proteins